MNLTAFQPDTTFPGTGYLDNDDESRLVNSLRESLQP